MLKTLRAGWGRLNALLLTMDYTPMDHVFERLRALESAVTRIDERLRNGSKLDSASGDVPASRV